jgi:hypothetical protein
MKRYRLHTRPNNGGVHFSTFLQFYHAMQTTEATMEHYSTVRYRFADQTQTVYRIQQDPVHGSNDNPSPLCVLTCPERPSMYIQVYDHTVEDLKRKGQTRGSRINTFKTVAETELSEIWTYTLPDCTYVLSKKAKGLTKELASGEIPSYEISSHSKQRQCVTDLFGRHTHGREELLHIQTDVDP